MQNSFIVRNFAVTIILSLALVVAIGGRASAYAYTPGQSNLKTLVLLVKFPGEPAPPVTTQQVKDVVFTGPKSAHDFFLEDSWGQWGLTGIVNPSGVNAGDVYGYLDAALPHPANECEGFDFSYVDGVDAQAQLAYGVTAAEYDRVIYVFPSCASGKSQAYADAGRAIVSGSAWQDAGVYPHELGHSQKVGNSFVGHSNGAVCDDAGFPSSTGPRCIQIGSHDLDDLMGGYLHLHSSFHRVGLGFLAPSNNFDVSSEGIYDIHGTAEQPVSGHVYNLRIPISSDPRFEYFNGGSNNAGSESAFLNLEYRQSRGQWDQFGSRDVTEGATIRIARDFGETYDSQRIEQFRVDTDPHSNPINAIGPYVPHPDYYYDGPYNDDYEPLTTETGFYDPTNDVLLRVVGRDSQKLQVQYGRGLTPSEKTSVSIVDNVLTVTAQPGYANDVYARPDGNGNVTVRDDDAPILASAGCTNTAKNVASCPLTSFQQILVDGGDHRDYIDVNVSGKPTTLIGGAGDDIINGGDAADYIKAGDGADKVFAKGGADIVLPGDGIDSVDAGTGNDAILIADLHIDDITCGDGIDAADNGIGDVLDESCEPFSELDTYLASGPVNNGTTADESPSFEFFSNDQSSPFECAVDGSGWNQCDSPYTTPGLPNGQHQFAVRASGSPSPDNSPVIRSFTVNALTPVVVIYQPSSGSTAPYGYVRPQFSVSEPATKRCSWDSAAYAACTSGSSQSPFLADGTHTLSVEATDSVGNIETSAVTFEVDNPVMTISHPLNGSTVTTSSVTPSFLATEDLGTNEFTYQCRMDSSPYAPCDPVSPPTYSGLTDGSHTFYVFANDIDGYIAAASSTFTVSALLPENRSISFVTPPSGTHSLTNEGVIDWGHWGRSVASDWDHKSSGGAQISNVTAVGGTAFTRVSSGVTPSASWTDGTPTAGSTGSATGISNTTSGVGKGYSLSVSNAQNNEAMTLRLHLGLLNCRARFELYWASDPGNIVRNTSLSTTSTSTPLNRIVQVTLRPPQASDTLIVRWTQDTSPSSSTSKVRLYSASLAKLSLTSASAAANADLTAIGTLDWAHWGTSSASLTQAGKASANEISAPAIKIGSGTVTQATAVVDPVTTAFSWNDGDSPASNTGTNTGIAVGGGSARGFSFTVPAASANKKTLKLFVGVTNTTGKLDLLWGSNTVPVLTDTSVSNSSGTTNAVYTIDLRHVTAGTTLKVQWTQAVTGTSGKVTLQSAALY